MSDVRENLLSAIEAAAAKLRDHRTVLKDFSYNVDEADISDWVVEEINIVIWHRKG